MSARKIEQACRDNVPCMALACGLVPAPSTIAAVVSSLPAESSARLRDILRVGEEQGVWGGTPLACDGLKRSSTAATEGRGAVADWRQHKATVAEKVKPVLAAHPSADQAREPLGAAEPRTEQATGQPPMPRVEPQVARSETLRAEPAPKRGKRGKALQRNVPDTDSATRPTAHGALQGSNGQALVEATQQVILPADVCGNGQDSGPGAPRREGAHAHGRAMGGPEESCEGKSLSADRHDHSEVKLTAGVHAQREASIPDPHVRQRAPRCAPPERHNPPPQARFTVEDFTSDQAHEGSVCPKDTV
jgi:hypothetical protein